MNLHAIASGVIGTVNRNIVGTLRVSTGSTTDASGLRVPTYTDVEARMQVQALSGADLRQIEGLNIEGVKRAVYLFGDVLGVSRPQARGGDLLLFHDAVWLVFTVLESWDQAEWCKVAVVQQRTPPPPPEEDPGP